MKQSYFCLLYFAVLVCLLADTQNSNSAAQTSEAAGTETAVVNVAPRHPTVPVGGPKHVVAGVIRGVTCRYPSELELKVVEANGKSLSLYNNAMSSIDLTVLGFTPNGSMNPCKDFEGMKARVQYVSSSDKTVNGQVIAVELRK